MTTPRPAPKPRRCPVCGGPLPKQEQARRVSYRGIVVCDSTHCESMADDLPPEPRAEGK